MQVIRGMMRSDISKVHTTCPLRTLSRPYGFYIVDRSAPAVLLDVHLENQQTLHFDDVQEAQAAALRRAGTKSKDWLEANKEMRARNKCVLLAFCSAPCGK